MTTTIYPNGIKVHCVWQDGTHMKEGEKIPLEVQKKAVQSVLKMMKEGKQPMPYTLEQEMLIYYLAKEKVHALRGELNDKKIKLSDRQRDRLMRELQRHLELHYTNRLNRQINI